MQSYNLDHAKIRRSARSLTNDDAELTIAATGGGIQDSA